MYRGNKKLRDETDAWRKQYPDAYKDDPNPLARAVEEILAGRSEAGKIDASLFQRIAAIVKNFARRMGFKGDMTDGEVNAILSMAHDRMVSGEKESAVVKGLRYMTAWHGSPHDFDRFSTEHMGTGEGAQAFGWGLYFADRKGVAESYRNNLASPALHINDTPYKEWAAENLPKGKFNQNEVRAAGRYLANELRTTGSVTKSSMLAWVDSIKQSIDELENTLKTGVSSLRGFEPELLNPETTLIYQKQLKIDQALLPVMEELSKHDITRRGGKLYQVDIAPGDDKFLSWDKPLYEQSDHVKDALRHMGVDPEAERDAKYPTTGADLYAQLRRQLKGQEATSKALLAAGIEGNKYLDANSRGPSSENPSHNYVVFNDNNVNITNKYMRPEVPPEVADRLESNAGDISEGLKRATNSFDTQEAATGLGTAIRAHASDGVIAGLQSYGDALHAELLEKMLSAFPTSGIVGWKGEEIPGLVDIENKLADMDNMKHNLLKYSDTLARDIDSFVRKNGTKALSKAQVTMRINEVTPEDFVGATTVQEAVMRDKMVNYVLDKINNFDPKGGVTLDQYITARDKRVDAVRDGFNTWQELNKSAGGQQLYMRMRDYFKDMYDASTALLDKRIQQFPDKAAASKLLAEVRRSMELDRGDKLSEAQKANDPYWMLPQGLLPKDYFPFLRSGKFWLRVAENAKAGRERQFYTFNSAIERDAALKNIAKRMGVGPKDSRYLTIGNNVDTLQDNIRGESGLLGRIFDTLDKAKQDTPSGMVNLRDLTDSIYQVYLMSMPERSIRRQFIHADEVTGMSMDVLKNFAAKATYYANNLSKMAFADDIHNTVKGAYENNRTDKSKPNDKIASDETFIREMATRSENALNPQRMDSTLNALNRVSFVYFLSSAKSILPHLLDVPRRMVPALGGEFGYTKALPKFAKYMDLSESLGALHTSDDGSVHVVAPNIGDSILVKSNPLLARAFEALNDRNVFGGMAANLIQNERASPKGSRGTIGRAIDATSFAMTSAFRYGEMLSRQTASMMAFELQHERLMEAEKPTSSAAREDIFNRAVDYAVQATKRNMGNYAGYERPTLLQKSALRRMVGAYKLWAIKQVAFLVGTANRLAQAHLSNEINDLKNQRGSTTGQALTALETQIANLQQQRGARRAAAAKEFAGVMMMTGMLSGVRGLPLIGLIATTLSALNNNPEDEAKRRSVDPLHADNPLVWFHNEFLPQHFGNPTLTTPDGAKHPLNNLIMDGALNELSGYDLGEAASMSSLFFKDSTQENNTRGSLVNEAISNIVPLAMVNNISTMVDHFAKGEIERGLEVGAPKGISDQLKANRYATEGIQNDNKIEMAKSEFNNADIIATALGIQPTRVKRLEDYLREDRQNLKAANTQRQALLHSYAKVYYEGGSEKQFNDAATAIAKFNQKYPVPSLTIDDRSIRSSVKDYYKNVENSYRGVTINKKNTGYEIPGIESVSPQAPSQDTDDSGQ